MKSTIDQTQNASNTIDARQIRVQGSLKETVQRIFESVDIRINGDRPWDIQIHDERLFDRVLSQGSIGLGEAYIDGWWDCDRLDETIFRVLRAEQERKFQITFPFIFSLFTSLLMSKIFNHQRQSNAFVVGERHYDIGNDLYQCMLDKRMMYTCALWKDAKNLDEAQEAKLEEVCQKLNLKPGMHLLDIGCGWGGLAQFAAQNYGVKVTGLTVSRQQAEFAREMCRGLPVEIRLQDYRDLKDSFDAVVSLGMFEHVGYKNYSTYMQTIHRCLKDNGIFVLRTIGSNKSTTSFDPWMNKYIFPNAMIPSIQQIGQSAEGFFVMEDWKNYSTDYDKTLMAWFRNFNSHWEILKPHYGDKFYRMWRYYLLSCAALFRCRREQAWQIVFSKYGILDGQT